MILYHYTSEKHGLAAIRDRRLKIATIDSLNDPFEGLVYAAKDRATRRTWKREIYPTLVRTLGLLCFSRSWKEPLLWAHYASNHAGVCLGLKVPSHILYEVDYIAERPSIDELITLGDVDLPRCIRQKHVAWKYEQEQRAFVELSHQTRDPENGLLFKTFDGPPGHRIELVEVYIGARNNLSKAKLTALMGGSSPEISTYKVRASFQDFTMVEQKRWR
ncbi:DUF2971 domain-containing protein [Shinella sp.]|uniref:DUF2971 domain-containing protein n=1 Tax=Shinella sp. TaxID=1870904 RepID=UPI0029B6EE89|nr:DUF2971 domain-containing protein [Shinella sp.]MDX3978935.1 DUF2971 domain-containing protein [Shinella sp.]